MSLEIDLGDIVALLALILAGYSMKKTLDFNHKQNEFIETNDKLNKLLFEKESQDIEQQKMADVSANFIKVSKNNHKLKVFNKGKNTAKNVRIEFPDDNELISDDEVNRKFPIPLLEQHQSVELYAYVMMNSPSRITVKLIWDDESGNNKQKILTPTIA